MSGYQGMRWFKCDLQVQTPEDRRNWAQGAQDDPLRLPSPADEQDLQDKARQYLRRCHEVGLDVVGVTDHNFCSHRNDRQRFLTHLIEQNPAVARECGREPLVIFPGFEVDIGYHVLCLFPPVQRGRDLERVCNVLSELGLPPDRRFSPHGPEDLRSDRGFVELAKLLRVVQDERGGIVIAAHAFGKDGIAKDGTYSKDFCNEDLLAVEVTSRSLGPSEQEKLYPGSKNSPWYRERRPAVIRSSDAKSIRTDEEGKPRPTSLGYRWTWIKMSEPSIEALRQAFLDPESRIRLDMEDDPRVIRHARIISLAVEGTEFLENQEAHFSPGLNCVIGGRGSGKSTVFEYLRFCLRREEEESPAAQRQVERIRKTLTPDSRLTLTWRSPDAGVGQPGSEDRFAFDLAGSRARIVSREVVDPSTVFRNLDVQMFSQGEITEISRRQEFLLPLIDRLVGADLRPLESREAALREEIRQAQEQRRTLERLEAEARTLEQEVQDLDRQWQVRAAVQEEQRRHRAAQEAKRWLDQLQTRAEETAAQLGREADDLVEGYSPIGSAVRHWPETEFFEALDAEVERARQDLAAAIRSAAEQHRATIAEKTTGSTAWPGVEAAIRKAEEDFRAACARQGLEPDELGRLLEIDRTRRTKALELESKRAQAGAIRERILAMEDWMAALHEVWRSQTRARTEEVERIVASDAVPTVPALDEGGHRPSIEIRIDYCGDEGHFLELWRNLSPDGRSRLGRQWEDFGRSAFQEFRDKGEAAGSPWQVVEAWREGRTPPPAETDVSLLESHLVTIRDRWERAVLNRVRDAVDLVLYRSDGSKAGSVAQGELSEGQRNTAVLTLLLASGRSPILIDQPEEELDSSFLYEQLVPLLRKIKTERQVIVVTHNPNLPVNGDAELVYALEARSQPGEGTRGRAFAQGGLDREGVKRAVLDVMEGSEEAFRKRREKYHF